MIRGILGAGLIWLAVGHGPDIGLPQPQANDCVRQASDAWRNETLKSLLAMRRELQANKTSLVWDASVVAGKGGGEVAVLTGRFASAQTP